MEVKGVKIEYLGHSGFLITYKSGDREKRIIIDPYNVSDKIGKAEYIFITHSHYDHCSIKDIQKLVMDGSVIVIPADAQSKITKVEKVIMEIVEPGDNLELGKLRVEVLPAYNVDKEFHPKSEGWLGYLIKINEVIIYHAGDSDKIPEMHKLSGYGKHGNEFVALLPVSGKYVMNSEQAADVASMINPNIAVPMHYGGGVVGEITDAEDFVRRCKELNINAKILEKI